MTRYNTIYILHLYQSGKPYHIDPEYLNRVTPILRFSILRLSSLPPSSFVLPSSHSSPPKLKMTGYPPTDLCTPSLSLPLSLSPSLLHLRFYNLTYHVECLENHPPRAYHRNSSLAHPIVNSPSICLRKEESTRGPDSHNARISRVVCLGAYN